MRQRMVSRDPAGSPQLFDDGISPPTPEIENTSLKLRLDPPRLQQLHVGRQQKRLNKHRLDAQVRSTAKTMVLYLPWLYGN
jgi:hypothetical protein